MNRLAFRACLRPALDFAIERDGEPLTRGGRDTVRIVHPRIESPALDRPEIHDRQLRRLAAIEVR